MECEWGKYGDQTERQKVTRKSSEIPTDGITENHQSLRRNHGKSHQILKDGPINPVLGEEGVGKVK